MKIQDFIEQYIQTGKVSLWVDPRLLLREDLEVSEEEIPTATLASYYVPRYVDDEDILIPKFEGVLANPKPALVSLKQAANNPADFDLMVGNRTLPDLSDIRPIPVATDTISHRTLILDSNHTVSNMFDQLPEHVKVIRIKGAHLEQIFGDFQVINLRNCENTFSTGTTRGMRFLHQHSWC